MFDVIDESKKKIRIGLLGADSPESSQAFGQRAKESPDDLIFGKTVTVASSKWDRNERWRRRGAGSPAPETTRFTT
jgi:endonuclease YncB( thermonuclease family)